MGVAAAVTVLLCMHWGFIADNKTTIEYSDLMMIGNPYEMNRPDTNRE